MDVHAPDPIARLKDAVASDSRGRSALKTPEIRAEMIRRIKNRVQNGAYAPNAQIIAKKILEETTRRHRTSLNTR